MAHFTNLSQAMSQLAAVNEEADAKRAAREASAKKNAHEDLVETLKTEEIAEALRIHERLEADLVDARMSATAAAAMLATAENMWDRAEKHTQADADRITYLSAEAPAAAAKVASLEQQIEELEASIAELRGIEEQRQRRERVEALYRPLVERMGLVVHELMSLLDEQCHVRDTLQDEGAWAYVPFDVLEINDPRAGDLLKPALEQWLTEAQRAGYKV